MPSADEDDRRRPRDDGPGALTLLAVGRQRDCRNAVRGQTLRLRVVEDRRVRVEALRHLVAYEVDQTLEDIVDVDVHLGRRLEELETC